ncbi:MAG TPA: FAD:protein FMN transferase [Patescibacteria group bacterium]|nr:FAD:protein FMN transferase [Patescibacteria group bacterium]
MNKNSFLITPTKQTRILMGMPITVEILDENIESKIFDRVFDYFHYVDEKYSPFKSTSELSLINNGFLKEKQWSIEMKEIFNLAEETKKISGGFFDIKKPDGKMDPSGIVKGWAIHNAAKLLKNQGCKIFYVDAGGDIEAHGKFWRVGIRNPFDRNENIKIVKIKDQGIATSGTYIRGDHIYNPVNGKKVTEIVSLTVIGPDIFEADRFATAAFAMGREAINFIERLENFEGYMIDQNGIATMTSGFEKYTGS